MSAADDEIQFISEESVMGVADRVEEQGQARSDPG
jgi:hypothetical protein